MRLAILFAATVKDGIALSFDSYSIEFYPYYTLSNSEIMSTDVIGNTSAQLSTTTSVSDNRNTNRISYNSAFGANTSLQYTPTLTGVKEDIILNKYTGVNEFHFIYKTIQDQYLVTYLRLLSNHLSESETEHRFFFLLL